MAKRRSKVAMFQTNSPVSSAKVAESLGPSLEKATMGGRLHTALKNE